MATTVVIMLVGMLVPVLAAAPFYVLDRRAQQREAEQAGQDRSGAEQQPQLKLVEPETAGTIPEQRAADEAAEQNPVATRTEAGEAAAA